MRIVLVFFVICLFSCSDKGKTLAFELCDCLKEAGLNESVDPESLPYSLNGKNECFQKIAEKIYETLEPLDQEGRAAFMREFSKSLLETDCADIAFKSIPYDKMLDEMDRNRDRRPETDALFSIPGLKAGPSVCDCVKLGTEISRKMDEVGDDAEKIKIIEKQFSEKIDACKRLADGLSDEEKKALIEEAKNCR